MNALILSIALAAGAAAQTPAAGGVLSLSCIEALAAIGQPKLAGVFSFVSEKDSPAAFADLVAHDAKALKKYVEKVDKDFRAAGGVTGWDHEALMFSLNLFSGPLAQSLDKPAGKVLERIQSLSTAPTLTLQQITEKRKK
ncbi:MAG: hypothetical protein HY926_12610 [Elusimicrobia bacterium]|nr:hypothetical protein [Elusimicrobiota bacterium]